MVKYPIGIDTEAELPLAVNNRTGVNSDLFNNLRNAIVAVEKELGIKPSGTYSNVRGRFVAIESTINNLIAGGGAIFGGDLAVDTTTSQTVVGFQGRTFADTSPSDGYVIKWNDSTSQWEPQAIFNGISIDTSATNDGYVLTYVSADNKIELQPQKILNVLSFIPSSLHAGIKNGTNTTDLSSYIQTAVNAYASSTNPIGRLYIPSGKYRIENTITLPGHQIIFGDLSDTFAGGSPSTEFAWYGPDGYTAFITGANDNSDWSRSGIENIQIRDYAGNADGYGLKIRNPQNGSYLRHVKIINFGDSQLYCYEPSTRGSGVGTAPGSWFIDDVYLVNGKIPAYIQNSIETLEIRNMSVGTNANSTVGCLIQRGPHANNQAAPIVITSSYVEMAVGTGDIHGFEWSDHLVMTFIGCAVQRDSATPVSTKAAFHCTDSSAAGPVVQFINCTSWYMYNLYAFDTLGLSQQAQTISAPQVLNLYCQEPLSTRVLNQVHDYTFWTGKTVPKITQLDNTTNSATGTALTIQAQKATGTSSTGGALNLTSGTGTSLDGYVFLQTGGNTRVAVHPTNTQFLDTAAAFTITPGSSGTTALTFADTVTTAQINQNSKTSGSGGPLTISAQSTSASSSTGGALNLNSGSSSTSGAGGDVQITPGTGTTFNGNIILNGNIVLRYSSIALSGSSQTLTLTESKANTIIFTGTLSGTCTVTITSTHSTNVTGQAKFVQNNCTGGSIVVKFNGDTNGVTIAPGNSALLVSDGVSTTNALLRGLGSNIGTGVLHSDGYNTTSSLIVDADVSSSANIAVSKLAPGTSAQVLLNSSTPTPTWTTLSSDVTIGSTGITTVNSISGSTPIAITPNVLQWSAATTTPTISQVDNATGNGVAMLIQAQNAASGSFTGGELDLTSGTGTTAAGNVVIKTGGVARLTVSPTAAAFADTATALTVTPVSAGTTTIAAASTVTSFQINWNSISSGNGNTLTISGQNTSAGSSNGGDITLSPGTGTSANGCINLSNMVLRYVTYAVVDSASAQSITVTNSRANAIVLTGALTANRTVTISSQVSTNVTGQSKFIKNTCTGSSVIVKYLNSSGTFTIPPGSSALVVSDGTNTYGHLLGFNAYATASGQVLIASDGYGTPTWTTLTSDVTINGVGATTVNSISGSSPIAITPATLQWVTGTATPAIKQVDNTANSATATSLTIQSQNATGLTSTGGDLNLTSGTGTTLAGNVVIQSGGTTLLTIGGSGLQQATTSVAIGAGGTITLTAAQYRFGYIILTGNISGTSSVTLVFPTTNGATWIVDATAVTLGANTITLRANGNNWGTTIGVTNTYRVTYGGTGKLYGAALTP